MTSHFLPVYRSNANADAAELRQRLQTSGLTFAELVSLTKHYRISAIATLLSTGNTRDFQEALTQSVLSCIEWFESESPGEPIVSRCTALFDALAANQWTLAQKLAAHLDGVQWAPEFEFEEDFVNVALFVNGLLPDRGGAQARQTLLDRYKGLEADTIDWRLEMWLAVDSNVGEEFEEALEEFLLNLRNDFEYFRDKDAVPPEEMATLGNISVEGISFWRVGRRCGFDLQSNYLYVPDLVLEVPGA